MPTPNIHPAPSASHAWRSRALSLLLWACALGAQAACNPSMQCCPDAGLGNPCDAGAGNPLNVMNGNKYQREVDMPALPGVLGLELVRHYNSDDARPYNARGILGRGWRLSYESQLVRERDGRLTLLQPDGRQVHYEPLEAADARQATRQDGATLYRSRQAGQGELRVYEGRHPQLRYLLQLPDQSSQRYDAQGLLTLLAAASGETTSIQRDPDGQILYVRDPQGRELRFEYPARDKTGATVRFEGAHTIHTPVGNFHYTYDTPPPQVLKLPQSSPEVRRAAQRLANLIQVQSPAQAGTHTTRTYHFEDERWPTLLTGTSLQGQRLASWRYDAQGRAVLSVKGPYDPNRPGPEQVSLQFQPRPAGGKGSGSGSGNSNDSSSSSGSGSTVLTNSLGQTTRYTYQAIRGRQALTEVRGAGCASCGPSNVRHTYNAQGQRTSTSELNAQGQPTQTVHTDYDSAQRPIAWHRVRYQGGKPQRAQLLQRLEYPEDPDTLQPRLIAWPSVVPGREHQIQIRYNPAGQPTEITETGYEPIGQSPITRTTRYGYQDIAGRSVLTHIDGPLANGPQGTPQDSDITTVQWDATGSYITGRTDPGGITTTFAQDSAGRTVRSTMNDGYRLVQTDTRHSPMGALALTPEQITRSAWLLQDGQPLERSLQTHLVLDARYDALGLKTDSNSASGQARTLRYDAAGRPSELRDTQGHSLHRAYDQEGKLLAEITQDAQASVTSGRLWLRGDDGRLRAVLRPNGVERIHAYLDEGSRAMPSGASPEHARLDPSRIHGVLRDDFGRIVQEYLPEDGTVRTDYTDQAGQEVQTQSRFGTDGVGVLRERLAFDAAGRLIRRHRGECEETLRYQGRLLAGIEGCGNAQTFERDGFGRITAHVQQVNADTSLAQRYRYDAQGRINTRELPDGQVLQYGYRSDGTQSVHWQRDWQRWLGRLAGQPLAQTLTAWLPDSAKLRTVVSDVQRKPFVRGIEELQALQHGNGERQTWNVHASHARSRLQAVAMQVPGLQAPAQVDAWGRQTRRITTQGPHQGQEQILVWNEASQLVAVKSAAGDALAEYRYDTSGNRIAKNVRGRVTRFVYDTAHRLVAEADAQGKLTRHYLYADHRAHGILEEGRLYAVHTDWRGLPQQVTDEKQKQVWSAKFDDWGGQPVNVAPPSTAEGAFAMPLRLAGQYADEETGLHYNIHRYFDPAAQRYISPDPLGAADGRNRYAYLRGNPWAGVDPLGLFAIPTAYFGQGYLGGVQYSGTLQPSSIADAGHGDILRIAFDLYQRQNGTRFSQTIIDQIILNNYHSDAVALNGGQRHEPNHFDNPNDGPHQLRDPNTKALVQKRYEIDWFAPDVAELDAWRTGYTTAQGTDISLILNAFGRNSHAIADFYSHSNWVDAPYRGGCYGINWMVDGSMQRLGAWVPKGLDQYTLWDETARTDLFSGTVCFSCGDIGANKDLKHTHAYWDKDDSGHLGGAETLDFQKLWGLPVEFQDRYEVQADGKGGYRVVKVAMNNKHDLAFHLAVMHTLREIDRLWNDVQAPTKDKSIAPGMTISKAFGLGASDLKAKGIKYQAFLDKSHVAPVLLEK